jgi:hypothetical protein
MSMMIRAAVLIGFAALAACNVQGKDPSKSDGNVQINAAESGEVSFNLPFASGQVKLPQSMMHNGNFDIDGVNLMPGSTMTGFSVFAGEANKPNTVTMGFKAPASPHEVRAYFLDQFKQKGLEAAVSGDAVVGKSKDGTPFNIRVSPAAGGSEGRIVIEDKN